MSWVKLHTKILDSKVFANEGLLKVWIYCLCRANRKQRHIPVSTGRGETVITLEPGQFLFGRNQAAKDLGMSPSTVRNRIKKLQNMGNISQKTDTHYTVVSICNWESYQKYKSEEGQPSNRQRTTKGQPKDTDKTVETGKTDRINIPFSEFWDTYNKKKGDKPKAKKQWESLTDSEREYIMSKLPDYVDSFSDKQYQPYPTTFLNQRRWESEDEMNRKKQQLKIYA